MLETAKQSEQMTWVFHKHSYKKCKYCKSSHIYQEIRNWSSIFHDGQIWCNYCESYLGTWDEKPDNLITEEVRMIA